MIRERAGPRRPARFFIFAAALLAATPVPAAPTATSAAAIDRFYADRADQPLWLADDGRAAGLLLDLLKSAHADGLDPADYDLAAIDDALRASWGGNPSAAARADRLLSRAFVAYVADLRRAPDAEMIWVDAELKPSPPDPRTLLDRVARAPDLPAFISGMHWMHPLYADLRRTIVGGGVADARAAALLELNLSRARLLPAPIGRHIVVNSSAQVLMMYEEDEVVDTMRVVVGKPVHSTPMMAAKIRFASLNPYWHVPPDLAAERIAPAAVKGGARYLAAQGYEVMSTWDDSAEVVDPATIDWQAVAERKTEVRIRQRPGPNNSMGQVKYMFPNGEGIYLHDTPQKQLLNEASRMFSGGCVRLEDAARLGRWLFGRPLSASSPAPEQRVDLPEPVPVYITYLTAMPAADGVAFFDDVYGRDATALGSLAQDPLAPLAAR